MKKRIALIVGGLFVVLLGAIVVLPFVINVDKYRPQIVELANEHLNGKLELGKLSLTLWGKIKIEVAGLSLKDAQGRKVVAAQNLFFHIPIASVLSGSPAFNLKMEKPEVFVYKNKAGKMNVMTIAKTAAASPAAPSTETAKPVEKASKSSTNLPGMVTRARMGIEMKNAHLKYEDEGTQLKSEVKDLNVKVQNISLSRPMEIEVSADLDTKMGAVFALKGPAVLSAKIDSKFKGTEFESAAVKAMANLDKVSIMVPGVFEKAAGLATHASIQLSATAQDMEIQELSAAFFNAEVKGSGAVKNFADPSLNLSMKSNEVSLKPWSELLPSLKTYDLGGVASFSATAWGKTAKPEYKADLQFKGITAKAPNLKAQPNIDGFVKVVTDKVESMGLTLKAPGNDLKVTGSVVSFTKPQVNVAVTSTGMDLDQWVEFPPPAAAKSEKKNEKVADAPAKGDGKAASSGAAPKADYDASLDSLRKNQVALDTNARITVDMKMLKAKNIKMTNLGGIMTFKNLALGIEGFHMGLFSGQIKSSAQIQMAPKIPTYRFNGEVAGLDLQEAVASQFEMFRNTLVGKASFKIDGTGSSFNPDPATKNLNAKGSMKVENATFATLDIGKMVAEGINGSIGDIANKVPPLKGKTIGAPGNIDSKYTLVTSDFTMAGGRFVAPNFVAKAEPQKGIDLKGETEVGMLDKSLRAKWEVIDTYNLTKARDLAVEQQGVRVEHILADGDQPVRFPIEVSGTLTAPKYSYAAIPEALGKVALNNVGKAVAGKAKAEVQKKAQEQLNQVSKKAPPAVQDAIKKFGGGLFGN